MYYYLHNVNGNVGQLVNAADGSIAARYEYDPYGNEVVADGPESVNSVYRFSTKYFDAETGLCYYGFRHYSPELGRWLNRDPIEEVGFIIANFKTAVTTDMQMEYLIYNSSKKEELINMYSYCKNNSLNCVDIIGLLRAVFYDHDDFLGQAHALLEKWNADARYNCEILVGYPAESIKDFIDGINFLNKMPEEVNAWVLMFHGRPDFMNLGGGGGKKYEHLSANDSTVTPKGNNAFPISLLPNLKFGANAYIKINTCRGGLFQALLNLGEAFNRRYKVDTYAYPYWIKYENEDSSDVIPSKKSYLWYPGSAVFIREPLLFNKWTIKPIP